MKRAHRFDRLRVLCLPVLDVLRLIKHHRVELDPLIPLASRRISA